MTRPQEDAWTIVFDTEQIYIEKTAVLFISGT